MKKLIVFLVIVGLGLAGGMYYESTLEERDGAQYKPPGKLVDIGGGRTLHLRCEGAGSPTVVFESSGLSSSTEWDGILDSVGHTRRACAYDRAGMGWSPGVDGDRSAADFVGDLHALLRASGEKPPYVLVGHSAGGALVRAFQAAHRDEVVGLVLVDTATSTLMSRWPKVIPQMRTNLQRGRWLSALSLLRVANPLHLEGRPAALTYRPRTMLAADQIVGALPAVLPSLPASTDVPTVVLTHARGGDWAGPGVIGPIDEAAIEQDWQAAQKELSKGPKSSLVVADKSGHMIPAEQPDLVIQAIDKVATPAPVAPAAAVALPIVGPPNVARPNVVTKR